MMGGFEVPQPQVPQSPPAQIPQADEGGNIFSKGFDFFFGAPTPEQAQQTLSTQPTDPAQRENLQAIVRGEERPSSIGKAANFLFGRPDNAGDPNILGVQQPVSTPQPDVPMATRESVADLSITGTPLTQDAITSPSVQSPQVQAAQAAQASQGLTTQSGIPLSQFLSGGAIPEAGLAAESPLYSSESRGISGEAGRGIMEQESAARMAGTFSPAGAGRAVSDRERRMATGEGTSMADLTDMAKANARGASPRDIARGQKVANELGVDLRTGQPIGSETETDLLKAEEMKKRNELLDQQIEAGRNPAATKTEQEAAEVAQAIKDGIITQEQANEAKKRKLLGPPPGLYDTWAEYEASTGIDADGDGKVSTPAEASGVAPEPKDHKSANDAAKAAGETTYMFQGKKYKVQ
jgi:hypothetical protein